MENYEIICIGLGISGLYFSYKARDSGKKILFLEQTSRIGGRIATAKLKGSKRVVEGGATRFFECGKKASLSNDGYLCRLVNKLDIKYTEYPNDKLKTNDNFMKIIDQLNKRYSEDDLSLAKKSLPSQIEIMGYSSREFADQTGYQLFTYDINLNMGLMTLNKVSIGKQNLLDEGFENLCKRLFDITRGTKGFKFKFNYKVINIYMKDNKYIINDHFTCDKLLFTGTIDQLMKINVNADNLLDLRSKLINSYFNYNSIRAYFKTDKPWWNKNEMFNKWNTGTPCNQIIYFTEDTILIYSNMYSADILYSLIPEKYKVPETFIDTTFIPKLTSLIERIVSEVTGVKNVSFSKAWYRYHTDCAQYVKPIFTNYEKFIDSIQKTDNFYMMSGDYTYHPGWVNSCLYCVEKQYKSIINF